MIMSCHHVVLLLMAHRDLAPDHPATLHVNVTGSNPCEDLFSSLGSFVANKRVYTKLEAQHTITSVNMTGNMTTALAVEGGVHIPRLNKRLWESWDEVPGRLPADQTACWLTNATLTKHWLEGLEEVKTQLAVFGLSPDAVHGRMPGWWDRLWDHDLFSSGADYSDD